MIISVNTEYEIDMQRLAETFAGDFEELAEKGSSQESIVRELVERYGIEEVLSAAWLDYQYIDFL